MSPRLADHLLDHAARVLPPSRRAWARAMRAELDHIPGPWAAAGFALGCVRASYSQRIADMMMLARLTRWTLAGLALAWAVFAAGAAALYGMIKARPETTPADLGSDPGTEQTLAFIQSLPAWELLLAGLIGLLLATGAAALAWRRGAALPLLAGGVVLAAGLALADSRLMGPAGLVIPVLCLAPVWWLSHRAPDLNAAA